MIEVIVDGINARNKLFDSYLHVNSVNWKIIPKNNEVKKYCKFLKSYFPNSHKDVNYLSKNLLVFVIPEDYIKQKYSIIAWYENFMFEFPDEETAFYFKMKYC